MGLLDTEVAKWKRAFGLLGGIPKTFKNNPRNTETMDAVFGLGGIVPGIGDAVSAAEAKYRYDQGDMLGAGLAGVGALPMIPSFAGIIKNKKMYDAALDYFGKTTNPKETGYILDDGTRLDLSGRHYATGYEKTKTGQYRPIAGQPDYLANSRNVDHRELVDLGDKIGEDLDMYKFIDQTGAVRYMPDYGVSVLDTNMPSRAQVETFVRDFRRAGDPLSVDVDSFKTGGNVASQEFARPTVDEVYDFIQKYQKVDGPAMSVDVPDEWYHGSPWDIYKTKEGWFRPTEGEAGVPVVWGTKNMLSAEDYARGESSFIPDAFGKMPLTKSWYKDYDGNGGVYALESKAKKPFEYDAGGKDWFNVQQGKIIREAKEKGHDAVIFKNIKDNLQSGGPADDVIAWIDPNAIYNVGKPARPRNHLGQVIPPTPYELAHAEAQRVAALPVEQGGLGLPPDNTAMDRARAMGFDTPAYRGVRNEVRTANEPGTYSTNLPDAANIYANSEPGANVMPVLIKNNAPYIAESYSDIGIFDAQKLRGLTDSGYDSAMYKQPNGANEYIEYISPVSGIRSRFAAFNPAKRDSADLLAGIAPWAMPIGATLLGGSFLLPPEEY